MAIHTKSHWEIKFFDSSGYYENYQSPVYIKENNQDKCSLTSPFISLFLQSLFEKNSTASMLIYLFVSVIGGALSCLLPETSGQVLKVRRFP